MFTLKYKKTGKITEVVHAIDAKEMVEGGEYEYADAAAKPKGGKFVAKVDVTSPLYTPPAEDATVVDVLKQIKSMKTEELVAFTAEQKLDIPQLDDYNLKEKRDAVAKAYEASKQTAE